MSLVPSVQSQASERPLSRRRWLASGGGLVLATGLSGLLAACGGGAPPQATTTAAKPAESKPTTAAPAAKAEEKKPESKPAEAQPAAKAEEKKPEAKPAAGAAVQGGTLKLPYPTWINPIYPDANSVMSLVYNGLVNLTADWNDVEPALAERWTVSPDGLVYTFFLRQNVKWHDGKPFTAADVEFTYKVILTKELGSIYAKNVNMIKGAKDFYDGKTKTLDGLKVVNDYQVEITLERPTAPFLLNTLTETCIIPAHVWKDTAPETLAKPATWEKGQVGTGPFKWSKFENDRFVELVRNDDYFRGKPNIEKVLMVKIGTTPEASAVALEKGELDYTQVPATEIERMNKLGHLAISTKPVYNLRFLAVNVNKPYFKDKRVRQALAYGVDRVGLCESVLLKVCEPWNSISVTKVWYNTELPKYAYDPAKAQALLKEAGWDSSREIELALYYNDQLSKDYIAAMQQQLAKIGMKAKIVQLDGPGVTPYYYQDKKFDIMYAGFGVAPDMDVFRGTFHSEATYPSGQNAMLYANPRIDELFTKGQAAASQAERKKIYDEVQAILADELPWVPLHLLRIVAGFNKRVQNGEAIANVWNRPYNWQIEKAWLSDGK